MAVTKGPPISGKLGQYGPKGVTKPVNTGYGPPVKKAQLPNALEVCNQIEARNLAILDQKARIEGTTAARVERDRYANILKESCEDRARKKGYFDPINDIRNFLFGGDDQALIPNHGDKDEHGNTPRPTPDGQPIQPLPGPFEA